VTISLTTLASLTAGNQPVAYIDSNFTSIVSALANVGIDNSANNLTTTGTLSIGGTFSSSKAAATNYTRVAPNFCLTSNRTSTTLTVNVTSGNYSFAAPAGAKAVILNIIASLKSANSVAMRSIDCQSTNAAYTTVYDEVQFNMMEFNATSSGTLIGVSRTHLYCPVISGTFYISYSRDAGAQSVWGAHIVGYFD